MFSVLNGIRPALIYLNNTRRNKVYMDSIYILGFLLVYMYQMVILNFNLLCNNIILRYQASRTAK